MRVRLGLMAFVLTVLGCGAPKPPADVASTPAPTQASVQKASDGRLVEPRLADHVVFETPKGPVTVQVEVVSTPAERRQGLMGREVLPAGTGMLFVFDTLKVHTFWMRNTLIPLDMIFIAGEPTGEGLRVVGIVHEATPHSTEIRSVDQASRFVVEVPGGWAAAQGISSGVLARFGAAQ